MIIIVPDPVIQELDHLFFEGHLALNLMMVMVVVVIVIVAMVMVVMMGHNFLLLVFLNAANLTASDFMDWGILFFK